MPILGSDSQSISFSSIPVDGDVLVQEEPDSVTPTQMINQVFGKDAIVMIRVAKCESSLSQFNSDGTIKKGMVNPNDEGIFQINSIDHGDEAYKMNLDIGTLSGNIQFAKWLFDKQGLTPWRYSKSCWNKQ